MNIALTRGIHYQSPEVYKFFTALKLRKQYSLRYFIAAQYVRPGEAVLDVCAGFGEFRKFLPLSCTYQAIEASPSFNMELSKRTIPHHSMNLHDGVSADVPSVDVITMIISLCQFRDTTADQLLEDFKKIAKRVVIVEDVLPKQKITPRFVERVRDYLCATDYYIPMRLFSVDEFQAVMREHAYNCYQYNERYWVGYYGASDALKPEKVNI